MNTFKISKVFYILLCLVLGSAFGGSCIQLVKMKAHTSRLVQTKGIILSSSISPTYGGSRTYLPTIRYKYSVGEKQFSGDRYSLGLEGMWKSEAQEVASQYKEGKPCTVLYNGNNPGWSCLVLAKPRAPYAMIIASAVIWFILTLKYKADRES